MFSPRPLPLLLLFLTAIGCGESRKSAPVTGTVTLNGQPVANVIVRFQPSGSGTTDQLEVGMSPFGTTDDQGNFTLRFSDDSESGAMIGDHTVTIDEVTPPEEENNDAGGIGKKKPSRIPRKWGDGSQTFRVEDRDNVAALSLD
ncbi:MAG: hypothetical protein ACOVRM_12260 [Planctomycetaceae bacterium]